jgi:predicted DNA-binding transcriptional regulator AlpA
MPQQSPIQANNFRYFLLTNNKSDAKLFFTRMDAAMTSTQESRRFDLVDSVAERLLTRLEANPTLSIEEADALAMELKSIRNEEPSEVRRQFLFVVELLLLMCRNVGVQQAAPYFPALLTLAQAGKYVGLCKSTMRRMIARGEFPDGIGTGKRGGAKKWRRADLDRYLESRRPHRR